MNKFISFFRAFKFFISFIIYIFPLIALSFLVALFICTPVYAGIKEDMSHYFDKLGFSSNITSAQSYQTQQAGYYTGGSLFLRSSVRNTQLGYIELPNVRPGRCDIDLFTGGFSFINSDALIAAGKNILNNAVAYSFNLALESAAPQIANVMQKLQQEANRINNMNINSCETGIALVGAMWPKTEAAQKNVCTALGHGSGIGFFDDAAASKQGCNDLKEQEKVFNIVKDDPKYKDMLLDEGNLAWKAIRRISFLQNDDQLAELFMSLSGSILIQKPGSKNPRYLPSLITNKGLISALLNGGEAKIYKCDEMEYCLNPEEGKQSIRIPKEKAFVHRVFILLKSIQEKDREDKPLNNDEKALLEMTPLPIYKMIAVQSAFFKHDSFKQDNQSSTEPLLVDIRSKAELIATEILHQYLHEILHIIQLSSRAIQYPPDVMNDFNNGIVRANEYLRTEREAAYTHMTRVLDFVRQAQFLEGIVRQSFSSQLSETMDWNKN